MSYITPEQQSDWASDLLEALEDTTTSNCSTVNWIKNNLGILNNMLSTTFEIVESGNISPEMNSIQSGIYNELYICHWLRKKAMKNLGSMEFDWTEMEGEDQGKIKRVSNTQKATTYQQMSKDCDLRIKDLVKSYRGGDFARPRQITFNGRKSTPDDIACGVFVWSPLNPIVFVIE